MPNKPTPSINLLEVNTRANTAQHIITGFSRATPNLADLWQQVSHSLSDIPILTVLAATLFAHDPATLGVDVLAGLGDDGVAGRSLGACLSGTVRLGGCRFGLVR